MRAMGVNQRAQIRMSDEEVGSFLRQSRTATVATIGPADSRFWWRCGTASRPTGGWSWRPRPAVPRADDEQAGRDRDRPRAGPVLGPPQAVHRPAAGRRLDRAADGVADFLAKDYVIAGRRTVPGADPYEGT